MMVACIDAYRAVYGVEPICRVLPGAPSTYYENQARQADPSRCAARAQRDAVLCEAIQRVWEDNYRVYGVRKVWRPLCLDGGSLARCPVARSMRRLGLRGAVRGRRYTITTIADASAEQPTDPVQRDFTAAAPNRLWVADLERHEALLYHAVMKGHRLQPVAAG